MTTRTGRREHSRNETQRRKQIRALKYAAAELPVAIGGVTVR